MIHGHERPVLSDSIEWNKSMWSRVYRRREMACDLDTLAPLSTVIIQKEVFFLLHFAFFRQLVASDWGIISPS